MSPIFESLASFFLKRGGRLVYLAIPIVTIIFLFSPPWELSPAIRDAAALRPVPALLSATVVRLNSDPKRDVPEIFGLLYFVTRPELQGLRLSSVDSTQPFNLDLHAGGLAENGEGWRDNVRDLNSEFPVVVFSKTYCQFSLQLKHLLQIYDLQPPPKIIEVDLRDDGHILKGILTRLTGRGTFPNVLVRGVSIGGFDDIHAFHEEGSLKRIFEDAGVQIMGNVLPNL